MNVEKRTHLISLVLTCLLVITFTTLPALAQDSIFDKTKEGVKKGAEGVGKGVKKGAHETKEGAEAVGKGTKRAITGDDDNNAVEREKGTEYQTQPAPGTMQQPATQPAPGTMQQPTTPSNAARPSETRKQHMTGGSTREKGLPHTAGELPLLGLSGALALAGAALSRIVRRVKN